MMWDAFTEPAATSSDKEVIKRRMRVFMGLYYFVVKQDYSLSQKVAWAKIKILPGNFLCNRMKLLVIGSGLAGISIAFHALQDKRCEVRMIDSSKKTGATDVATGMMHPLSFKVLKKGWRIDELLPYAVSQYRQLESWLGTEILRQVTFRKYIKEEDYRKLWKTRLSDGLCDPYLGELNEMHGRVNEAWLVDCPTLKKSFSGYLKSRNLLLDTEFDADLISQNGGQIRYGGEQYDAIVLCQGPYATENKWFDWLPFNLCTGQWVTIHCPDLKLDYALHANGITILPLGDDRYKISSTYEWDRLSWEPEHRANSLLLSKFTAYSSASFEVIDAKAGIRPTVADRRPYLGAHPTHKHLYIFNGLGSKGLLLAPFFGAMLYKHIDNSVPLDEEVDIRRHLKRFFRQV
ncbi:MAG: FAD-dependent oxidoreductase [Salibacteraceae bacterium]